MGDITYYETVIPLWFILLMLVCFYHWRQHLIPIELFILNL